MPNAQRSKRDGIHHEDASMLGCSEQRLSEYIDGDLSRVAAREVEHHLWSCARCREMFRDLRMLLTIIARSRPYLSQLHRDTTDLHNAFRRAPAGRMLC
jgi:anti-sigma factor RsiW